MRATTLIAATAIALAAITAHVIARQNEAAAAPAGETVKILVGRLDLDRYKATIKGLTQFGDRLEGTDRNRMAVDWIEAQLKSDGCANTERLRYSKPPAANQPAAIGATSPTPDRADSATPTIPQPMTSVGGGRPRGYRVRTDPNNDSAAQPDLRLRDLNSQPSTPGPREEVYCTKIGTVHPDEMYIVGAHMDGRGYGEAANDNGSGTALVMELARIMSLNDVETDRSIRFILWNSEEGGLVGSREYVAQRKDLQGLENPIGSGRYPEPKWLGMIQHDMMLFDHGMPRADGTVSRDQRAETDINIEFQLNSKFSAESAALAWVVEAANEKYATHYPATIGSHMSSTDSGSFQDLVAAISLRENERGTQIGSGWDPQWHQATDLYTTYSDKDFLLGLNAAQTTLAAIAQLAGATLKR